MSTGTAEVLDRADTLDAAPRSRPMLRALTSGQGLVGVVILAVIVVAGLCAPWLTSYDPNEQIPGANLLGASADHWFGTDQVNRDLFTRTLYGIRTNLLIVLIAVPLGAVLGALFGLLSSLNSVADVVTQRIFDLILAFPLLILAITLVAITGPGVWPVVAVIVAAEIPIFGRLVRTTLLKVRELPYVEAAEVIGAGRGWVLRKHILPNALEPLSVQLALSMSAGVFAESAMSFLGIGVRPPDPSLGSIIAGSVPNLDANPAYAIGPLIVVSAMVLSFLLIAQGLNHARRI